MWGSRGPFETIAGRFQTTLPYQSGDNWQVPIVSLHSNWWGGTPNWFSIACSQGDSLSGSFCKAGIGFATQWWNYSTGQANLGPLIHSPWVYPPTIQEKVPAGEHNVFFYHLL